MDFSTTYPHPSRNDDPIELQWKRGYGYAEVWYRGEKIKEIKGSDALIKGVRFHHELLGDVNIKLSETPYVLNLIVNGLHSPINQLHPNKTISGVSGWFWLPLIIYGLILLVFIADLSNSSYTSTDTIVLFAMNALFTAVFLATIILCRLKHYYFVYIGTVFYFLPWTLQTVSILLSPFRAFLLNGLYITLSLLILGYGTGMVFACMRVHRYYKHKRVQQPNQGHLLDS